MSYKQLNFIEQLAHQYPSISRVLKEHIENYDEIIPHVFMGDLTRWITSEDPNQKTQELAAIINELENTYLLMDPELNNLIELSFIENLPKHEPGYSNIIHLLPKVFRT